MSSRRPRVKRTIRRERSFWNKWMLKGDLMNDPDFDQAPLPPLILPSKWRFSAHPYFTPAGWQKRQSLVATDPVG